MPVETAKKQDRADRERDRQPLEVEAQHATPRRVAFEDDLFTGMQVHGLRSLSSTAPVPAPIVQVEPLTTARALRGPFDYLRPDGRRRRLAAGGAVRPPAPDRGGHRVGRGVRAQAGRAAARAARRAAGRSGRSRALAGARVRLDARAGAVADAAAAWSAREGPAVGAAHRRGRGGPAGLRSVARGRGDPAYRQAARALAAAAALRGQRPRLAAAPGGARAGGDRPARAPPRAPAPRGRRAQAPADAHARPAGGAGRGRWPRSAPSRPAACSCTASPAPARPRSTCAPPPRRWPRGAAC